MPILLMTGRCYLHIVARLLCSFPRLVLKNLPGECGAVDAIVSDLLVSEFSTVNTNVKDLSGNVDNLNDNFNSLHTVVNNLDIKFNSLDTTINNLDVKFNSLDSKVKNMDEKIST